MDRRRRSESRSRSRSRPQRPHGTRSHRSREHRGSRSRSVSHGRSHGRSLSRRSRSEDRHSRRSHHHHRHHRRRSRSFSADRYESRRRPATRSRSRSHHRSSRRSVSWERGGRGRSRSRDFRDHHHHGRDVRDRSWDRRRREPSRDRSAGRPPARRRGRRGGRKERQRRELKEQQKRAGRTQQPRDGSEHSQRTGSDAEQSADASKQPTAAAEDSEMPDATDNATGTLVKAATSSPAPQDAQDAKQRTSNRSSSRSRRPVSRKGAKIPENWVDVPKLGDIVRDSRFVPMRCPLDAKYAHLYASPDDAWSPQLFLEEQAKRGYGVGMVIDLTNTLKYYDGEAEFRDSGVEYVKLKIEGFNAPPRAQDVEQFTAIVDTFVAKEPRATIAVHCTHGLNRTGYLIAHYLVTKRGCSVKHALESFSLARPPGLIKHMYVDSLYRLLGDGETVELPELPMWAAEKYGKRR